MEKKTRYFVEFWHLTGIVSDTSKVEFPEEPNPEEVIFPDGAYAFSVYKFDTIYQDGKRYITRRIHSGKTYWHPDSYITDYEQTKKVYNRGRFLLDNMKRNGWEKMIWTRYEDFPQPYNPDTDIILPKKEGNK